MAINMTEIVEMSKEQVITTCNSNLTIPTVIITTLLTYFIFFLLSFTYTTKAGKSKYLKNLVMGIIFSSFIIAIMLLCPNIMNNIIN